MSEAGRTARDVMLGEIAFSDCRISADSMVGHRTARYAEFGWASARLDDLVNWIPARLTALLFAASAFLVRGADPGRDLDHLRTNYGTFECPADDDRAAQGEDARFLGLRLQIQIVLLVAKVDLGPKPGAAEA